MTKLCMIFAVVAQMQQCVAFPDYITSHGTLVYNECDEVPTQEDMEFYLDYLYVHGPTCFPVDYDAIERVLSESLVTFTCGPWPCGDGECAGRWRYPHQHKVWWDEVIWRSPLYHELMHSFLWVKYGDADPGDPEYLPHDEVNYGMYWDGVYCLNMSIKWFLDEGP